MLLFCLAIDFVKKSEYLCNIFANLINYSYFYPANRKVSTNHLPKIKKSFLLFALLAMGAIIWTNCSKTKDDNLPTTENTNVAQARSDNFALTTNDVSLENGTLVFRNQQVFDNVAASLNVLDQDEAFKSNFIASKGESALDDESPNFVINPAAQAFEERFSGYASLRKKVYTDDANATTTTPAPTQDIQSPILQTLLNDQKEVKIGDLIYKDIDEHHTFVVLDGNLGVLNELRSLSNPLTSTIPRNVIRLDDRLEDDQATARGLLGPDCYAAIGMVSEGQDKFSFTAFTYLDGKYLKDDKPFYTWYIYDKNGLYVTGANTTNDQTSITVSPNTAYPISVQLVTTPSFCNVTLNAFKKIATGTPNCATDIVFFENGFGSYDFTAIGAVGTNSGNTGTYTWSFTQGGVPTTLTGASVTFTPVLNGASFTATVTRTTAFGCTVTTPLLTVAAPCGTHFDDRERTTPNFPGTTRRTKCVLWIDNKLFYHAFGAKQLYKRVKNNGNLTSQNATAISFQFAVNDRFLKDCTTFQDLQDTPYSLPSTSEVRCEFKDNNAKFTVRAGDVTCTYSVSETGVGTFPNHTVLRF